MVAANPQKIAYKMENIKMNTTIKTALTITFAILFVLLMIFGGWRGSAMMGGINLMWILIALMFGLCAMFVWFIFGKNQ